MWILTAIQLFSLFQFPDLYLKLLKTNTEQRIKNHNVAMYVFFFRCLAFSKCKANSLLKQVLMKGIYTCFETYADVLTKKTTSA